MRFYSWFQSTYENLVFLFAYLPTKLPTIPLKTEMTLSRLDFPRQGLLPSFPPFLPLLLLFNSWTVRPEPITLCWVYVEYWTWIITLILWQKSKEVYKPLKSRIRSSLSPNHAQKLVTIGSVVGAVSWGDFIQVPPKTKTSVNVIRRISVRILCLKIDNVKFWALEPKLYTLLSYRGIKCKQLKQTKILHDVPWLKSFVNDLLYWLSLNNRGKDVQELTAVHSATDL